MHTNLMLGLTSAILCRAAARVNFSVFIRYAAIMVALRDTPYMLVMYNKIVNTQTVQSLLARNCDHAGY